MGKDNLLDLMRSKNTIFTTKDVSLISLIWEEPDVNFEGIYAKDKNYEKYELATKIFTPSYISFETVLCMTVKNKKFTSYGRTATIKKRN